MPKVKNTLNPFAFCDAEALTEYVRKGLENAPPFGSPENLAQLEEAATSGEQMAALITLPTDTPAN